MTAVGHFGCPRLTFDHISGHFRSIRIFLFIFFVQNGCRRPFWMSEIHFRSHFWPFQIDTQFIYFLEIFDKMAAVGHFWCPKFTFDGISGHFRSIRNFDFEFFYKMAASGHFWSSKINFDFISGHFRSIGHFGCLKFTFDSNSGHFRSIKKKFGGHLRNFVFEIFYKMAAGGHFGSSKINFDCISGHFWSIGQFGCPKFTFDDISGHFRSIRILIIFLHFWQNVNYRTRSRYLDE